MYVCCETLFSLLNSLVTLCGEIHSHNRMLGGNFPVNTVHSEGKGARVTEGRWPCSATLSYQSVHAVEVDAGGVQGTV